jgi:hypothetical protein
MSKPTLRVVVPVKAPPAQVRNFIRKHSAVVEKQPDLAFLLLDSAPLSRAEALALPRGFSYQHCPKSTLYEALTLGIAQCAPEAWILVLGLDDELCGPIPWPDLAAAEDAGDAALLFDVEMVLHRSGKRRRFTTRLPNPFGPKDFLSFPVHHQGFVVKQATLAKHPLRPELGLAADYEQMIRILGQGSGRRIDIAPWVAFKTGGLSDYARIHWLRSLYSVAGALGFNSLEVIKGRPLIAARLLLKSLLPRWLLDRLR